MNDKTSFEQQKRRELQHLWKEIEKAIVNSPDVRLSLTKYQAIDSGDASFKDNIILEIDKLSELIEKDESPQDPTLRPGESRENSLREMVKKFRSYLIKSLQSNLKLIESCTQLTLDNNGLKKKLLELDEKHKKALKNIEKILVNMTRNPN